MIPDFRTYVNESVWSDIHRRSNGTQERKEDDLSYINDMTVDDFIQFLRNEYPSTPEGKNTFISEWDNSNVIGFPIIINNGFPISIFLYNCKKGKKWIGINSSFKIDYPDIISIIEKKYKERGNRGTIKIYKDDPYEDITNLDFIKLIDYLLNNITHHTLARKKRVDESVWSDIHRRSNGAQVRKEDDINNLDYKEFFDYIYINYWPTEFNDGEIIHQFPSFSKSDIWKIQIPVEVHIKLGSSHKITPPITINANKSTGKLLSLLLSSDLTKTYPEILDIYKFDYDKFHISHIVPQKGELTNQFCVDVIDKILSIVKKPLFYRKTHK